MEEIWKPVVGYEGLYEVSNLGNVRSLEHETEIVCSNRTFIMHKQGRLLKPIVRQHGYLAVQLYGRGGHKTRGLKTCSIHRLVAEAFLPNPNGYTDVNHKDECKTNNQADNLEWLSHKDNTLYGTAIERRVKVTRNNARSKKIAQYTLDGELLEIFPSLQEANRRGYAAGNICKCAQGNLKYTHAYGYQWRYVTED